MVGYKMSNITTIFFSATKFITVMNEGRFKWMLLNMDDLLATFPGMLFYLKNILNISNIMYNTYVWNVT